MATNGTVFDSEVDSGEPSCVISEKSTLESIEKKPPNESDVLETNKSKVMSTELGSNVPDNTK